MANIPRPRISIPTTPGLGTRITTPRQRLGRVAPIDVPETTIPSVSTPTYRDVSLEITDTQEGRIAPICYGRVRFAPKIVHFDIVNQQIEMIVLVGEGEIEGYDAVYVDGTEVYAASQSWATVQVRTGSLTQTAVTCISNATLASMTHPGYAYVALRLSLLSAPLIGGIPQVEVAVRGLKVLDYYNDMPGQDYPVFFRENPVAACIDALRNADYGCGVTLAEVDQWYGPGSPNAAEVAAQACDTYVDDGTLAWVGQAASNTEVGAGDYDRLQSFKAPYSAICIRTSITLVAAGPVSFPFQLRASPDGAEIGWAFPMATLANQPPGTYEVWAYYGRDLMTTLNADAITPGSTYYLVLPAAASANIKWRLNSLTNGYADGQAQAKITGVWTNVNYDHVIKVARAEKKYRISMVVSERQPIEQLAQQILQTCGGRLAWWDGLYRVTLDGTASGSLVISDLQSPAPDIPIIGGSLVVQRSDAEVPNEATGTYLDTETWKRLPVKVDSFAMQQGLEQPRVLDVGFVGVPSGGQLYRLLTTWLTRAARTLRAQCDIPQHGLRLAPGDTVQLTSCLFAGAKTMIVDDISDAPGGTFRVSLLEYSATDFSTAPYVPQTALSTITAIDNPVLVLSDDFTRGGVATGTVGELGWTLTGTGTITYSTAANHPGICNLTNLNILLNGAAQLYADNSVWAIRYLLSPTAWTLGSEVIYVEVAEWTVSIEGSPAVLKVSSVSTGVGVALNDWIDIKGTCAGNGTATLQLIKNGIVVYTTTATVSNTTPSCSLRVTVGTSATCAVDLAQLIIGVTR